MPQLLLPLIIVLLIVFTNLTPVEFAWSSEKSASSIYEHNLNSIVLVGGLNKRKKNNTSGSGFIIKENGLIVTNWHVVSKAKKIVVRTNLSKNVYEAKLVKYDKIKDIAIIQIKKNQLKPVTLASSKQAKIGDRVFTIGNPLGLENSISDGLISAIREFENNFEVFQISVPLSAGSSGGPLFNQSGEVVGITTATLADGQALNFAVPSNYLLELLKDSETKPSSKLNKKRSLRNQGFITHIVASGESLYSVSQKYNVDIDIIQELNHIKEFKIYVGQKLRIPAQTKEWEPCGKFT